MAEVLLGGIRLAVPDVERIPHVLANVEEVKLAAPVEEREVLGLNPAVRWDMADKRVSLGLRKRLVHHTWNPLNVLWAERVVAWEHRACDSYAVDYLQDARRDICCNCGTSNKR